MNNLQKKLVLNTLVSLARAELERSGDNVTADRLKIVVLRLFLTLCGEIDFHQYVTGRDTLAALSDGAANDDHVEDDRPLDWSDVPFVSLLESAWSQPEMDTLNLLLTAVVPTFDQVEALKSLHDS